MLRRLLAVAGLFPLAVAEGVVLHPVYDPPSGLSIPDARVVGRWGGNASCVAIDSQHVLTTRHQGGGVGTVVVLDGVNYDVLAVSNHATADLRVARIRRQDGGPANLSFFATMLTTGNESGDDVVFGGYGKGRGAELTNGGTTYGYSWSGTANTTQRWGANRIDAVLANQNYGLNDVYQGDLLRADFDGPNEGGAVTYESAVAAWDSGGGWFVQQAGAWKLAGLSHGVEHGLEGESWFRNDQDPSQLDPDTLVAVRVKPYASWVLSVVPEPQTAMYLVLFGLAARQWRRVRRAMHRG